MISSSSPMNARTKQQKSANISDVNKQILEIKKKIQLSEGQRKALFEIRDAEYKANVNEITRLKNEISQIVLMLRENKSTSAKNCVKSARVGNVLGPLSEKPFPETQEMLDLQLIDKSKKLNLIRYRVQQRETYLARLANEYQVLISEKEKKEVQQKIENPVKIATSELQNSMHAVKIQWREAIHVSNRYKNIKLSLQQDSGRFEFNIKCAEDQIRIQNLEIDRLQKIVEEASQMRGAARTALLQQEKEALNSAKTRDQQESEGKKLVIKGKQELEKLERRIFQSGKTAIRTEAEERDENGILQEASLTESQSENVVEDIFEKLKQTTGSTTFEEVVERYQTQRDTDIRLNRLRNSAEIEKRQYEKKQELLTAELEQYKYEEAKDIEQNLEEVSRLRSIIQDQENLKETYKDSIAKAHETFRSISRSLNELYLAIHPLSFVEGDCTIALERLENELQEIITDLQAVVAEKTIIQIEKLEIDEEKWLPPPYGGLVAQTPVPQEGTSPIPQPAGSDDEEEVPTRGYLKRQAQLVVDARSRRKNIRIQRR